MWTNLLLIKYLKRISKNIPEAADWFIPVFECQLAHDGESENHRSKVCGRKLLDWKMDGVRTLSVLDKESNKVTRYTRNGQIIETIPEVQECLEILLQNIDASVVLDGELMSPQGFQHLMTLLKNPDRDTSMVRLALFDIVPLEDFRKGFCPIPQWQRHKTLANMQISGLLRHAGNKAYVVEKKEVDLDTPEGRAAFEEFNREAIENGVEGIMIKDPEAPYEAKRTASWLKKKPVIELTMEVIAVEPGKADGKRKNVMGSLTGKCVEDGKTIISNVGSGFTDEQLEDFWNRRHELIGMMMEVRADKITLESGETTWSLRFPRFKGFRGSVPGEKI